MNFKNPQKKCSLRKLLKKVSNFKEIILGSEKLHFCDVLQLSLCCKMVVVILTVQILTQKFKGLAASPKQ
jgi:hypothetical protein